MKENANNYHEIMVPMRDGVRLQTELYLPAGPGPFPSLLARSVYGTSHERSAAARYVALGYAVVLQNVRGRHGSEGTLITDAENPYDGVDTVDWMIKQPWCDGRVATFGGSALGAAQVRLAFQAHPAHVAMAPQVLPNGMMSHCGGAFMFSQIPQWLYHSQHTAKPIPFESVDWMWHLNKLPVVDVLNELGGPIERYRQIVTAPHQNYFSRARPDQFTKLRTPALLVTGWYDHCATGAVDFFQDVQRYSGAHQKENTHLVIGPWDHANDPSVITEYNFGPGAKRDHFAGDAAFFDRHLRGNAAAPKPPPVRLFVMGHNEWRDESEWPLARTIWTKFYLHAGGSLNPTPPADEPPDQFVYDPANPVPAIGGTNSHPAFVLPMKRGPRDQRPVLNRPDVFVFTSEPVTAPLEITGPLTLGLYAASSARDTDFTGKLMVVRPDGNAMLLQDGIVRARYRHGVDRPELLTPGQVERYEIDLWFTSYEFQPGERIAVAISSSNFPRFSRNLNTGGDNERDAAFVTAEQTIFHDAVRPSHILLPVIPA